MGEKKVGKIPRKVIHEIIAVAVGVSITFIPPPDGLTAPAMWVLGLLVWGMVNWVLQPMPTFVTMLIMCCMWIVLGILPFGEAFSNFAGSTVWLLIGALAIGVGASKSGLLKRMALFVLKLFKPTYNGMLLAFLCSGVVLGPAIPSSLAKGSIVGPVSTNIASQLGFKNKSNGMVGIFTAMFAGYSLLTASCISSSVYGYTVIGLMPQDVQEQFNFVYWFLAMLPWTIITLVLSYFGIKKVFKPEADVNIVTKADIAALLDELGPMNRDEKITSVIIVGCIALWILQPIINISSAVTALLGMCAMGAFGILQVKDFDTRISWSLITFVGGVIAIASAMNAVGFIDWLGITFGTFMGPIITNPYLFIVCGLLVMFILRFIIPEHMAAFTTFIVIMMPFCLQHGVNPWLAGIIGYVGCQPYLLYYMNMNFVPIFEASGGEEVIGFNNARRWSIPNAIISGLALLASVPYWQMLGIL